MNSQPSDARPDIFEHTDYRAYLRDMYDWMKAARVGFSYRKFSAQAGFSAPNVLKLVIEGQRNIAPDSIRRFTRALDLSAQEGAYFRHLVLMNQAAAPSERAKHFQAMAACRNFLQIRNVGLDELELFSQWDIVAVRELVAVDDFVEDPEWIARRLKPAITRKRAAEVLDTLKRAGYLGYDDDGRLIQADPLLTTADKVNSFAVRALHTQMIARAQEALERWPRDHRNISGFTVSISERRYRELLQRVHELRNALFELVTAPDTECDLVVQLNVQAFPLTATKRTR